MTKGNDNGQQPAPTSVEPERVEARDPQRMVYLAAGRGLIVKRSLLATAMGAVIPVPVMDEYVAGRVRAGLLMKLAEQRKVDLPRSSAELLGDAREGSTLRNATMTAITLVALKLAWRKIFALLAAGRGAEEMASNFQFATLFDHYCARMHVGGPIDRERASDLRKYIHETVDRTEKATLAAIFRDGGRILGRSLLEAPRWVTARLSALAQRWVSSRGNVSATLDPANDVVAGDANQWLDRASAAVESGLTTLGSDYLEILVGDFEARWAKRPSTAARSEEAKQANGDAGTEPPEKPGEKPDENGRPPGNGTPHGN
jgi:hypothetical protein